ncbi:MAG TPA: hypothetical protein VNZ52_01275 [Candidatus Thermoplasmatota archaeon]|nr:hypothetical protein [Candidatus Thermoplasmatota archaeon]
MSEGLVTSNKVHRAIFVEVFAGNRDPAHIAKKARIIRPVADRAIADLERTGILAREGEEIKLTPAGERLAHDLKRKELLS